MANEKVYVLDDGENQREGMTKEQILAAIAEAISTGQVTGDYSAFIEMIKEQNKGVGIKMWVGTQAELLALPEIEADTIYYVSDLSTLADLDNALADLKKQLTDGSFKVGKAGAAGNVTGQIAGKAITSIFEADGTTVKEATKAGTIKKYQHEIFISSAGFWRIMFSFINSAKEQCKNLTDVCNAIEGLGYIEATGLRCPEGPERGGAYPVIWVIKHLEGLRATCAKGEQGWEEEILTDSALVIVEDNIVAL